MGVDIEDLGSCVFEELAFDYLAYNPLLSEARVIDHYNIEAFRWVVDYDYYIAEAKKLVIEEK